MHMLHCVSIAAFFQDTINCLTYGIDDSEDSIGYMKVK